MTLETASPSPKAAQVPRRRKQCLTRDKSLFFLKSGVSLLSQGEEEHKPRKPVPWCPHPDPGVPALKPPDLRKAGRQAGRRSLVPWHQNSRGSPTCLVLFAHLTNKKKLRCYQKQLLSLISVSLEGQGVGGGRGEGKVVVSCQVPPDGLNKPRSFKTVMLLQFSSYTNPSPTDK